MNTNGTPAYQKQDDTSQHRATKVEKADEKPQMQSSYMENFFCIPFMFRLRGLASSIFRLVLF